MSSREENFGCEHSVDAAPYVLGALEEVDDYRAHLEGCATCRAQVAELRLVVDTLPATVPPVLAPEALRERVLATVRSEAELLRAAGGEADRPPARPGRSRTPRVSPLRAGIALAAAVAVSVAVAIGLRSGTPERVISARVAPSIAGAHASLREANGRAELVVSGMPQPPRGRIYEVWLARGSAPPQPTDALFGVTGSGLGSVSVPGNLHGVKEVMVTAEPLGGSSRPTGSPLLRVTLHA
jgi:anti-sigma-K factor RskA